MVAHSIPIAEMTDEAKRRLLSALVRDLIGTSGKPLEVSDPLGGMFVYTVPFNARERAEQAIRNRTPEYQAELDRRAATPEDSAGVEEWLKMHRVPTTE